MGVDGGVGRRASDLAPSVLLFSGPARRKIPSGPAASSEGQASPERWRETVFFPNSAPQVRYRPVDLALSGTPCHREPRGPLLRPSPRSHSASAAHGKHGVTILSERRLAHPLDDRGGIDRVTNDAIEGREAAIGLPPPLRGSPTTTTHTHTYTPNLPTHTPHLPTHHVLLQTSDVCCRRYQEGQGNPSPHGADVDRRPRGRLNPKRR